MSRRRATLSPVIGSGRRIRSRCVRQRSRRGAVRGYSCRRRAEALEPLRVRPFGRLLGSYTVNDLGDSIGVVALSVLVFDRTEDVAPTAGFFLVAKFLPALFATGLTAHLDRFALRATLPAHLRDRGARVRRARRFLADRGPLLPAARARCSASSTGRWRSPAAG